MQEQVSVSGKHEQAWLFLVSLFCLAFWLFRKEKKRERVFLFAYDRLCVFSKIKNKKMGCSVRFQSASVPDSFSFWEMMVQGSMRGSQARPAWPHSKGRRLLLPCPGDDSQKMSPALGVTGGAASEDVFEAIIRVLILPAVEPCAVV